jgi:hypothetical protein
VVEGAMAGQDEPVPRLTKVWMVPLGRGSVDDIAGDLELAPDAIIFTPKHGDPPVHIPLGTVVKVKRLKGSPVLMVLHGEGAVRAETAFYFVQPPPLSHIVKSKQPPPPSRPDPASLEPPRLRPFGMGGRKPSKRKSVRSNATYLTTEGTSRKEELQGWVDAIRERLPRT